MIYFDNAATGGFKTQSVLDAVNNATKYLLANPTRSGHRLALTGARIIYECRENIAKFFDCTPDRVIFTKNCTEALNLAIFGTLKKGGHIITTVYEHNSVLRPLYHLKNLGLIELDIVKPIKNCFLQAIEKQIKKNTYLVITTSISNVNGESVDIKNIGELCKKNNILYLVDGAQGGGHIPLSMKTDMFNMLCLAGHKGLYGIMGSGVLIVDEKINLSPLIFGGTGTDSFSLIQPEIYPEKLEAGTLNLPAISALNEGVKYIANNINNFGEHLYNLTSNLINGLNNIPLVKCYSKPNKAGICAFSIENLPSSDCADILNSDYDIAVRGGLHCAPLMHKYLHTENGGLIRASLSAQNTTREINFFLSAIEKIAKSF